MTETDTNAYLIIGTGASAGERVPIDRVEFYVGRSDGNELVLADPSVSRQHVVLRQAGGKVELEDLGSTGGTFVNGKRVQRTTLQSGDRIALGDTTLRFEQEPGDDVTVMRGDETMMRGGERPVSDDAMLPATFVEAQRQFWSLRDLYERGKLDEQAYRLALKEIIVQDNVGSYWMLGADSGEWYRHEEGGWIQRDPPRTSFPVVPPPPAPPASRLDRGGETTRGRIAVVVLGVLLFIATCVTGVVAISRLAKSFEQGDAQIAMSPGEILEPGDTEESIPMESEAEGNAMPSADSATAIPQEPPTATPTETSIPTATTPPQPIVTLHIGDARTFSQPPAMVAYANTQARPEPPEVVINENCNDRCWRYNEWLAMGTLGLWIDATSTEQVTALGVELWGDQNDGWARVLLDGDEVWRGDTRGADGNWPGGAFVRYLEIAGLPLGIHTLRVEPLGEGGSVTMYFFGFGQVAP
jgi:pSer/pThr/pTyr-binding forkhead associated (FHA) protein